MFRRIGIITRQGDDNVRAVLRALIGQLQGRDCELVFDPSCHELLGTEVPSPPPDYQLGAQEDLVIAVGGDGTMLGAARLLFRFRHVRLLGINLGRLGFLTDLTPELLPGALDAVLDGAFTEEERFFLHASVERDGEVVATADALNDVVIQKWNTARLISFDTRIDDVFVHTQRSDGMIITTPTGSTAYALSGGGPIVHPGVPAIGLVPICPHTLTNRPLIVSNDSRIDILVDTEEPDYARVTCDGVDVCVLQPRDRIRIARHETGIHLIHPAGHDHFATLRAKLQWGRDLC